MQEPILYDDAEESPSPLTVTTSFLPPAPVGLSYYFPLLAEGGTLPYRWGIEKGQLPGGFALNPDEGAIQGMPEAVDRREITLRVTDAAGDSAYASYVLEASESGTPVQLLHAGVMNEPLYLVTGALSDGDIGVQYSVQIEARGGVPPYTWAIADGDLPAGLSLDPASGLLSGIPRERAGALLVIQVTDHNGNQDSAELMLRIDSAALTIVTENLPRGELDKAYDAALSAENGAPPYRWSLTVGELPTGISLASSAGILRGTPAGEARDYEISVSVTDANGDMASRTFTLSIAAPSGFVVTNLSAVPSDGKVGITWANPVYQDYAYTVILRSTSDYPASPVDATVVYSGAGADFLDAAVENGVTYYYGAVPVMDNGTPGALGEAAKAAALPRAIALAGTADPFADEVVSFQPLSAGGYGSATLSWALGAPGGGGIMRGSTNAVSLHARANDDGGATPPYGGSITLAFTNNIVVNGEGPDFVVFENVFYVGGDPERRWMEPAIVSVSKDGSAFYTFPYDFVPHYTESGEINCYNPYCYINADGSSRGFAGVTPVYSNGGSPDPRDPAAAGGDAFDLSAITQARLDWVRYVRITATGDNWLTDTNGDRVRQVADTGACSGAGTSGFDLDAVCAIHY